MEELVKLVQNKAGISEDNARTAVNTVIGFLEDRLPDPLGSQLRNIINNPDQAQSMMKGLGGMSGMFGGGKK